MLMGPDQCAAELKRLFADQHQAAEQMLALLAAERESLTRGNSESLEQIATEKSGLTQQLQTLEAEQRRLLKRLAFADDPASALDRALDWCDPDTLKRCRPLSSASATTSATASWSGIGWAICDAP